MPVGGSAPRAVPASGRQADSIAFERLRPSLSLAFLLLLLATGCVLGDVTATEGDDILVVEGHLQAGSGRQMVLLHRSVRGSLVRGESGASVTVTTPDGRIVPLPEAPQEGCASPSLPEATDSLDVTAACYTTESADDLTVVPGGTYELNVISVRGERLRGRTTVPGGFVLRRPNFSAGGGSFPACSLPRQTNLPIVWSRSTGAWSYLSNIEISGLREALEGTGIDAPDRLELTGLAISENDTTLVLPSEFGLFELTNVDSELLVYLQDGFPAGVTVRVRLSALDRNYVNAIRGGSFNPSGVIRISSVVGDGVGVFGSLVSRDLFIVVEPMTPLRRC